MPPSRPFRLLHVEDDDDHHELLRLALQAAGPHVELARAHTGQEAIECFESASPFEGGLAPDLVVLDLRIPAPDGHEVLGFVKRDPRLRRIPVIVLTSSAGTGDIRQALDGAANAYVVKPTTAADFERFAAELRAFWEGWHEPDPDRDASALV